MELLIGIQVSEDSNIFALSPYQGEMLKPKELIEVKGQGKLTLQDRRIFNKLIENAWGPKLAEPGTWFEIDTASLKALAAVEGKRVRDSIEKLMTTFAVSVIQQNGEDFELRTPLLSTNKMSLEANTGSFYYTLPVGLADLVKNSNIFAKLDLEVMKSFRSKFAFSLYEALSVRIRLKHIYKEELSLQALRDLLGVEDGKLEGYGNLNKFAIKPALEEVNAITPYAVSIVPKKEGKKVVSVVMGWSVKSEEGLKAAYSELHRHSKGRKRRTDGDVDVVGE